MASDLISRVALLKEFAKSTWHDGRTFNEEGYFVRAYDVHNMIDKAPAVDAEPVRHGKWVPTNDKNKKKCSRCEVVHLIAQYPYGQPFYCPNCGAKMGDCG